MGCETKQKGDVSEAVILAEFVKLGVTALQPFGDNKPYDLVIECGSKFYRIQCKTGRLRSGRVLFKTVSTLPRFRGGYEERAYTGKVDYFGVYCKENQRCYLVPVGEVGKGLGCLRIEAPKNNQAKQVRWARDFEFEAMVGKLDG